jgi:hypothetical protein
MSYGTYAERKTGRGFFHAINFASRLTPPLP